MGTKFGFVSTYPPTHCGIATFSASLITAIQSVGSHSASVIRLIDADNQETSRIPAPEVVTVMKAGDPASLSNAVDLLNELDVAIVQHEFGIYGGPDGDEVLTLLRSLRIPTIVILHTVLAQPTDSQRAVFVEMCSLASAVVTMSKSAREQMVATYLIDPRKIYAIPHGARALSGLEYEQTENSPLILTWGLIGPGKGIEWAIEAMHEIRNLDCNPRYLVAGRTHPKVFERNGEAYRKSLQNRINDLGLTETVRLEGEYMNSETLDDLIASAAIVLLPYDSKDQATSGVLIEAVAAWRPVVATGFPHARELLSGGAGIVVDHRNPKAMADALRRILNDSELATQMSNQARVLASGLLWPAIARRYAQLANVLIHAEVAA